jgi:hypothetical protein
VGFVGSQRRREIKERIGDLKERLFLTLSSGEQRMLLLARAFVKDPDLRHPLSPRTASLYPQKPLPGLIGCSLFMGYVLYVEYCIYLCSH